MKVLIAAASFGSGISGIQRHALNLVRCLLLQPEMSELHFVVAPWQSNLMQLASLPADVRLKIHIASMNRNSLSRNLWYYRQLPELASQLQADLVHLSYPMPLNVSAFHCPTVVTLHDLYPYEIPTNFGFPKFIVNRMVLQQCLRSVDAIACVSEATRLRLKQYLPAGVRRKAIRIYNCVNAEPVMSNESPIPGATKAPFLLCIAQHRRNKNIPLLIRAFDRLLRFGWIDADSRLVMIGIRGPETARIHGLASELGLSDRIQFLDGLSEPELQWCYGHCEVLVAPSRTEGFGLPVAEGILAGCRIVCSDIPAHREIGDAHCRFFSLRENPADALVAAIADNLNEAKPTPASLPHLSAPVLAHQYLALYRRLIDTVSPMRTSPQADFLHTVNPLPNAMPVPDGKSALVYRGE
jgi:glycosyltransferase involved in cell wall biosynthesis